MELNFFGVYLNLNAELLPLGDALELDLVVGAARGAEAVPAA